MHQQEDRNTVLRQELLVGTVQTVAVLGLENTTTNAICRTSGVNFAYIYRIFADKEDLIAKAFAMVDLGLLNEILRNCAVLQHREIDCESRCRVLFAKCWDYLMKRPQELTFYVHYYYSASFAKYSQVEHVKRYAGLFEKVKPAFPDTVDAELVLHHIFNTLLGEAMRQASKPGADNGSAEAKCFELIFSVVKNYVKQEQFN